MFFTDPQGNLHELESVDFMYLLPPGCVEISEQDAQLIQAAHQAPPLGLLMAELREKRDALLTVMTSIQGDAMAMGDVTTAQAIVTIKQAFKDIPALPSIVNAVSEQAFRDAAKAAYRAVTPLVPASIALAVATAMKDYVK